VPVQRANADSRVTGNVFEHNVRTALGDCGARNTENGVVISLRVGAARALGHLGLTHFQLPRNFSTSGKNMLHPEASSG
jgi:flagellar basal body rod protein FlgG